jgi:acyl dehydratase
MAANIPEGLSIDLVGARFEPETVSWTKKDIMLYALGVGCKPANELDFVYEGSPPEKAGPTVLPTYAVMPGMKAMGNIKQVCKLKISRLLHGEQAIYLERALPPEVKDLKMESYVSEVWDKGKAGVIGVKSEFSDEDGLLFSTHATLFYLGGGGFGGEPGPNTKEKNKAPDREPDITVTYTTQEEQGALYRLSGDMVALHIDPKFAQMAGYDKPFMHGLCTYGFVGRAALHSLCDSDPSRFVSMEGRFSERVQFCDDIVTKIWKTEPGVAIIQAENQNGDVVLSQAKVCYK